MLRFEREFFKLALVYLACRRQAMLGCDMLGHPWTGLEYALLGMFDYADEMRLLIEERRHKCRQVK